MNIYFKGEKNIMKVLNGEHVVTGDEYFRQKEFCPYDSDSYAKSTFISKWTSIRYLLGPVWLGHKFNELNKDNKKYYPMNPYFTDTYEFIEFEDDDEKASVSKFNDDQIKNIEEKMACCYRIWDDWCVHYIKEVSDEKINWIKTVPVDLCPACNKGEVVLRHGRYGDFNGCSRFPECRYIENKFNDDYLKYRSRKLELIKLKETINKLGV